ncbi:MAG: DUF3617 domain-containing protein [Proteobacteria bacterium]|nr:DUF3617 domain-containing protein [Pseudomonadota bacterium]MBU1714329.1 DUF3617 domain-containing protein [Pseudomonadota bacterium]
MLRKVTAGLIMMFGLGLIAIPVWGLDFKPGLYEITSKVEMPGMPAGAIPAQTITQCMTEQDPVPSKNAGGEECKVTDMKQSGNSMTWKMKCDQQEDMISEGKMTYNGDSFSGTITTMMGPKAGNMTIVTRISGKRIGDCK